MEQRHVQLTDSELNQYFFNDDQMEDLDQTDTDTTPESDSHANDCHRALHASLVDCIHHHQMLLEFSKQLDTLLSPVIFAKWFQITTQICNLTYLSTKVCSCDFSMHCSFISLYFS